MRVTNLADRKTDGVGPLDLKTQEKDRDQTLQSLLRELLDQVSKSKEVGVVEGQEVETYEGGGYFYVETSLASRPEAEIDISIQGGRAVIRIAM